MIAQRTIKQFRPAIFLLLAAMTLAYLNATSLAEIPANRAEQIEAAAPETAPVEPAESRRVLIFLTPPHLMPKDPHKGYCIPYGAHAFKVLGEKTGAYEPVVSDDLAMFLPDRILQFDAIVLNNTSQPWITPTNEQVASPEFKKYGDTAEAIEAALRKSLLGYVRGGGGLMAIHYGIGGNRHWPEFAELLGAVMNGHPWNEEVGIKLDEPGHPLLAPFGGKDFRLTEETFQFREPYSREKVRVLMSLDTATTNMTVPWIHRTDGDFALAWVKPEGKGRVFYTAIGHRTEHYWNPVLLKYYLGGVQFCTGDLNAPMEVGLTRSENAAERKSDQTDESGFMTLFDGNTLKGWKGDPTIWSVEDGVITGQTTASTQLKANNFLMWQGGQPGDFELRLEFKLVGGNSGIYFHSEPRTEGDPLVGPQADFSADHRWTGVLMEWKKRDVLAERGQKVEIDEQGNKKVVGSFGDPADLLKKVRNEDWNEYTLITRGPHTILKINGTTMSEVTDRDPRRTPKGYLAVQVHRGPPMKVQFRNIRIKQF